MIRIIKLITFVVILFSLHELIAQVAKTNPVITWGNPADITYGAPLISANYEPTTPPGLPVTQLNAKANVPGTFVFTPPAGTILKTGNNQVLSVKFFPADSLNYNSLTKQVKINVVKLNPSINWNTPSSIVYGTRLSDVQLNATIVKPTGAFNYNPIKGTLLNAGSQILSVTFIPTDTINFLLRTLQVTLNVIKASQKISFNQLPDKTIGDVPFTLTASIDTSFPITYTTTSDKISIEVNKVKILKSGKVSITANQSGNDNFESSSVEQAFCIKPSKPTITISDTNTEAPTLTSSAASGNQWYLNGTLISQAINQSYSASKTGVYKVQAKTEDCLSEFSSDQSLVITGDINSTSDDWKTNYFPNPATNILTISFYNNQSMKTISIYELKGMQLSQQETTESESQLDIANYSQGLYLVKVYMDKKVHVLRFEKR